MSKRQMTVVAWVITIVCAVAGEAAAVLGVAGMTHHTVAGLIGVAIPIPLAVALVITTFAADL